MGFTFTLFFVNVLPGSALDKIKTVPLINLEELSPTFEEEKDELEKIDEPNANFDNIENSFEEKTTENEKLRTF